MFNRLELYIEELQRDPVSVLITMAYTWAVLLISLILHEVAHGYVAYRCGDPTAKMMGRLSLNPLHHLDPMGTLFMLFAGFGWAKPVPVNPRYLRRPRRDHLLVSLAGVTVNLTIFLTCVLLSCVLNRIMMSDELIAEFQLWWPEQGVEPFVSPFYGIGMTDGDWSLLSEYFPTAYGYRVGQGIYTLSGWALLEHHLNAPWLLYVQRLLLLLAQVNLTLCIFNLFPIPPLDGFHVLNNTLLMGRIRLNQRAYQIITLVFAVLMFSGVLMEPLSYCVVHGYDAVLRLCLMLTGQA